MWKTTLSSYPSPAHVLVMSANDQLHPVTIHRQVTVSYVTTKCSSPPGGSLHFILENYISLVFFFFFSTTSLPHLFLQTEILHHYWFSVGKRAFVSYNQTVFAPMHQLMKSALHYDKVSLVLVYCAFGLYMQVKSLSLIPDKLSPMICIISLVLVNVQSIDFVTQFNSIHKPFVFTFCCRFPFVFSVQKSFKHRCFFRYRLWAQSFCWNRKHNQLTSK